MRIVTDASMGKGGRIKDPINFADGKTRVRSTLPLIRRDTTACEQTLFP